MKTFLCHWCCCLAQWRRDEGEEDAVTFAVLSCWSKRAEASVHITWFSGLLDKPNGPPSRGEPTRTERQSECPGKVNANQHLHRDSALEMSDLGLHLTVNHAIQPHH